MKRFLNFALLSVMAFSPVAALKAASLIGVNYGSSLDTSIEADTNINVNAGTDDAQADVSGNSSANANANATSQTNTDTAGSGINLNSRSNSSIQGDIMTVRRADLDDEGNRSAVANFRSSANTSAQPGIPNTGVSAVENANVNAFEHASEQSILLRARDVATQDDLRIFALAAIDNDENLNAMSFANDEVRVSYKAPGHFIGIVPVRMDVDVTVDPDGKVEFDYPWYGFLVTKDMGDLEADIKAEVETAISAEADGGWTNYDRAELAAKIAGALKARYESNTATTTDEEV